MTMFLAIIGALTGVSGLAIQFYTFLSSRPKISIEQVRNTHDSIWIVPDDETFVISDRYKISSSIDYSAVLLQITINNLTPQPVTLLHPTITVNDKEITWRENLELTLEEPDVTTEGGLITNRYVFPRFKQLTFPHRLEGYGSVTGSIVFLNMHDSAPAKEAKIVIPTTNKKFTKRFVLGEFSDWRQMAMKRLTS